MNRRQRSEKGFTLLEFIVALAILSLGMLGVGTMMLSSMKADRYSVRERRGDFAAVTDIEDAKALGPETSVQDLVGQFSRFDSDKGLSCKWTVTKDSPLTGLYQVNVTVGWAGSMELTDACKADPENCPYKTTVTNFVLEPK